MRALRFGLNFFNRTLSKSLGRLGGHVADRPKTFILLSVITSLLFGSGLILVKYTNDPEYLYTPKNGESHQEQQALDRYFPSNYSSRFNPSRPNKIGRFLRIIIEAEDGGTLFRKSIWDDILQVNQSVHEASIEGNLSYSEICARWEEECYENDHLYLGDIMEEIERGEIKVNYPIMFDPKSFRTYTFAHFFGGIVKNETTNFITSTQSVLLNYIIAVDSHEDSERGSLWEKEILRYLDEQEEQGRWKNIKVFKLTYNSFIIEQEHNFLSLLPFAPFTILIVGIFSMGSATMRDWTKGKPWLGVVSMNAAGLGILIGFGFSSFIGWPIVGINIAIPFIMLGIGLDDSFVMLASWRRTSSKEPVRKRLSETYSEAAVSITITTLTDSLSFFVGVLSPIPSVQSFSVYAGTCAIAIYFVQILFFGAVLAISGIHEAENRHSLIWWKKTTPKSLAENESRWFRAFWTGGINPLDPDNPKDNQENTVMKFFRDDFAPWLISWPVNLLVIVVFCLYIGISTWGLTQLDEGLRIERLYRYDSYIAKYFEKENQYFRKYPHRIQFILSSQHDFYNETVQNEVLGLIDELSSTKYTTYEFGENWLSSFLTFKKNWEDWNEFNITNREDFMELLTDEFLKGIWADDVILNENKTEIIATRYVIQGYNIPPNSGEKDLILDMRSIAKKWKNRQNETKFEIHQYNPWAPFGDQFIIIRELAIQLVLIASIICLVVCITLIPNLICCFWVLFSILSIIYGVLGFMTLWGISLDMISIINLLMCIGFSVDFSAHITYTFVTSKGTVNQRISNSLYSLGYPILQAAISSLIGICALALVPSYIFIAFVKIISLVIIFAVFHSLFFLPVMLWSIGSCRLPFFNSDEEIKMSNTPPKKKEIEETKQ